MSVVKVVSGSFFRMSILLLRRHKVNTDEGCILSFSAALQTLVEGRTVPKSDGGAAWCVYLLPSQKECRHILFCFSFTWEKKLPRQFNCNSAPITEKFCLDMNQTAVLE